jgi:hypothetical protein
MNPRHGEVWLVDMGMAAKTRPAFVLIADHLNAPRSLIKGMKHSHRIFNGDIINPK